MTLLLLPAGFLLLWAARAYWFRCSVWRLLLPEWRALGDIEEDLGMRPSRMGGFPQPTSRVELLLDEWHRRGLVVMSWGSTGRTRRLSMVYLGEPIYALARATESTTEGPQA